jgi:hypothetical protein
MIWLTLLMFTTTFNNIFVKSQWSASLIGGGN